MQPLSLLNLEAHTQGFLDACSPFHKVETGYTGLHSHQPFDQKNCLSHPWPSQALEQNQLLMDDILEQLLSCSELGGFSGIPLNQSFEIPESDLAESCMIGQVVPGFMDEKLHAYDHTTDDSILLVSQMQHHQGGFYPDHDAAVCSANPERNSSYGVPQDVAAQLSQPFVSGFPHFKMMPGNITPEVPNLQTEQTPRHMHLLGKRCRDPAASIDESGSPSTPGLEKLFHLTGMEQVGKSHNKNTVDQQSAASPSQLHASKPGLLQRQELPAAQPPVRPRVRARRGQATDPHSIAERLRRERIAERMKSLQELVPNSNKTDKASMLDEIIEYVKFLQLQVKVLSMSRLGGARVAALSTVNLHSEVLKKTGAKNNEDLCPSQNAVGLLENQIAQLMEEDMGTAMQYLQNKGLCLMPIALANAISSKNNSSHSQINGTDVTTTVVEVSKQAMEAGICDKAASSLVELLTAKDSSAGEHITINAPNDAAVTKSRKKTTEIKHKEEI